MDLTLVVMAAGMGSRFGGLKQIEPFGPSGEFIIDYSVYDAIKAGFNKVVFIIKEENYDIFKETIGKRIESKIKVEYAFQKLDDIPSNISLPSDRVKPLGTGQALYAARDRINSPFVIINSDDFYGRESFEIAAKHLKETKDNSIIGYEVKNTIGANGPVKRGVIYKDKDNNLNSIKECSIERHEDKYKCETLDGSEEFVIDGNQEVSMNMFGLHKDIIDFIREDIKTFLNNNKDNLSTCEYLLPNVVSDFKKQKGKAVKVLPTKAVWYGVTYKEDKDSVVDALNDMIIKGIYPKNLWK